MAIPENRTQQLQVALAAVEDGAVDSDTLFRAVRQWLSDPSSDLGQVLAMQPDLSDASRQAIRSRFATLSGDLASPTPDEDSLTVGPEALDRLRVFLREHDAESEPAPGDGTTIEFALGGDNVRTADQDATATYASPLTAGSTSSARSPVGPAQSPFSIVREFARGGLGVLYLARDSRLQRDVIVKKIIPKHARQPEARDKFVLEAEVTGQLEHPSIVPIYFMSHDEGHEPYYAMRLISGKNLNEAIKELHAARIPGQRFFDGRSFREILQRFIDICQALEYAHSRGVIHRDLKPANIMLGKHGETLVIDWGLAKILSKADSRAEASAAQQAESSPAIQSSGQRNETLLGSFGGTVRYAPPEQLAGEIQQLGPACDIYSLGAILFDILCLEHALAGDKLTVKDALAMIRAGQLRSPSKVDPTVPRPLNAICVKAMALEISDRYRSAGELAEDVERWLADECVLAYRHLETRPEQVGRWLRHHRGWAAGIVLSLVVLAVSAGVATFLINRARLNEQTAKRQAIAFKEDAVSRYRVAKSALDTLMERSDGLQDVEGATAFRAQLVQQAAQNYAQLAQIASSDPELEIERARAMVRVADAAMLRTDLDEAQRLALALREYDQVVEMLSDNVKEKDYTGDSSTALARQVELARTYTRRGATFWNVNRIDLARQDYQTAIAMLEKLSEPVSSDLVAGNLAVALLHLASMQEELGNYAPSLELAEKSLQQYKNAELSEQKLFALNRAKTHQLLHRLYRQRDERKAALSHLDQAEELMARWLSKLPGDAELLEARASLWLSAANGARDCGDLLLAVEQLNQALQTYMQLSQKWGASDGYDHGRALCHLDLAIVLAELERRVEGQTQLEAAFQTLQLLSGRLNAVRLTADMAEVLETAGMYLAASTEPEDSALAIQKFSEAIDNVKLLEQTASLDATGRRAMQMSLARKLSHRARQHVARGDSEAATADFEQAVRLLEQVLAAEPSLVVERQLAHTLWHQATHRQRTSSKELVLAEFQRVIDLWQRLVERTSNPRDRYELGKCYLNCPLQELQDPELSLKQAELCVLSVPGSPLFEKLLADAKAAVQVK